MNHFSHNKYGALQTRQSRQRHHDQAQAQLIAVVLVAGIVIGIAALAIVIGVLQ